MTNIACLVMLIVTNNIYSPKQYLGYNIYGMGTGENWCDEMQYWLGGVGEPKTRDNPDKQIMDVYEVKQVRGVCEGIEFTNEISRKLIERKTRTRKVVTTETWSEWSCVDPNNGWVPYMTNTDGSVCFTRSNDLSNATAVCDWVRATISTTQLNITWKTNNTITNDVIKWRGIHSIVTSNNQYSISDPNNPVLARDWVQEAKNEWLQSMSNEQHMAKTSNPTAYVPGKVRFLINERDVK